LGSALGPGALCGCAAAPLGSRRALEWARRFAAVLEPPHRSAASARAGGARPLARRRHPRGSVKLLLIGAGGHAQNVYESLAGAGHELAGYVDPRPCRWLDVPRWADDSAAAAAAPDAGIALGIGGVVPAQLSARLALLDRYRALSRAAPAI